MLIEDGAQVPLTPSLDFVGRSGAVANWQIESGMFGKVGTKVLAIVTTNDTLDAQSFDVGKNV